MLKRSSRPVSDLADSSGQSAACLPNSADPEAPIGSRPELADEYLVANELSLFPVSFASIPSDILETAPVTFKVLQLKASVHTVQKNDASKCELWASMWSSSRVLSEVLLSAPLRDKLLDITSVEIGGF